MKRIRLYEFFSSAVWLVMVVVIGVCFAACSESTEESFSDEDGAIKLNFAFGDPDAATRFYAPADVSEVYIYGFAGRSIKANNLRYAPDETGAWTSARTISWPARNGLISLYGLTTSFENLENDMTTDRSFIYQVPNGSNAAQDVWFGSTLNTTKTESDGSVNMHFSRLLSIVNLQCNNSMVENTVVIRKVIIHNLVSAAKFTYHESVNGRIEYSLQEQWANYTYDMSTSPLSIEPQTRMACTGGISNSSTFDGLILVPQKTNMWVTANSPDNIPVSTADTQKLCYIELVCKIIGPNDNYIWGHASGSDEWESVYIPLNKTWKQGKTVSIPFDMSAIRAANGDKFQGHAGNQITFDENFEIGVDCDVWDWDIAEEDQYKVTF